LLINNIINQLTPKLFVYYLLLVNYLDGYGMSLTFNQSPKYKAMKYEQF